MTNLYHLTFVDSVQTKRVQHVEDTWENLAALFAEPQITIERDDVGFPLFVPAHLKTLEEGALTQGYTLSDGTPAYSRSDANVISLSFLSIDVDNDPTLGRPYCSIDEAVEAIEGLSFILYTSFNHKNPDKHNVEKFRILLPYASSVSKSDVKARLNGLKTLFPFADHAGFTTSQPFYRPLQHPDRPYTFRSGDGIPFDLFSLEVDPVVVHTHTTTSTYADRLATDDLPYIRTVKHGEDRADRLFDLMQEGYAHRLSCYRIGDSSDKNPGCFIIKHPAGLAYFDTDQTKQFFRIQTDVLPTAAPVSDIINQVRERSKAAPTQRTEPGNTLVFEAPKVLRPVIHLSERYLPEDILHDFPSRGIVAIRSPKGSGKTERISNLVTSNKRLDRSTLLIGHRIHLLRNLSERTGLTNYQDTDTVLGPYSAVCLNSLSSRSTPGFYYDTIIIDESEQVLQSLVGDHLKSVRNEVYIALHDYIKHARLIVFLDADLTGGLTLEVARLLRGERDDDEAVGIINDYPIGQGRTTLRYADRHHLLRDALVDAADGEQVFYTCNSINRATTIARAMETLGKNVLLVTSATGDLPHVQAFIANPAEEAIKYDCLVTSPTLSTGVSIDAYKGKHHFTRVYGEFGLNPGTYLDADQALSRVRCETVEHRVWIQANTTDVRARTEQELFDEHTERHRLSSLALPGTNASLTPEQYRWALLCATIDARVSEWSIYKPQQFDAARRALGWTIQNAKPSKSAAEEGKEAYNQHKPVTNEHAVGVFTAAVIGAEEYDSLSKRKMKTPSEGLSMERYRYTLELAKIGEAFTLENLTSAIEQNLLSSLRFARVHIRHTDSDRRYFDETDRAKNVVTFTDLRHNVKTNEVLFYLCSSAGIDYAALHKEAATKDVEVSTETLEKVANAFVARQRECNLFFKSRIKDPTNPTNFAKIWNATLGKHNVSLSSKQLRINGEKKRVYTINREAASFALRIIDSGKDY